METKSKFLQSKEIDSYLPSIKGGIDFAWISVMCVKFISAMPLSVKSLTLLSSDLNEVSVTIPSPKLLPGTAIGRIGRLYTS